MISVFAAFMLSDEPIIKSMGFALAVAVFFDAFIVRMTLIPALMYLMGEKAWWLPALARPAAARTSTSRATRCASTSPRRTGAATRTSSASERRQPGPVVPDAGPPGEHRAQGQPWWAASDARISVAICFPQAKARSSSPGRSGPGVPST